MGQVKQFRASIQQRACGEVGSSIVCIKTGYRCFNQSAVEIWKKWSMHILHKLSLSVCGAEISHVMFRK